MRILKNDFVVAALLGVVLTALSYLLAVSVGWIPAEVNWFEVGATVFNYGSFYLCVKQRRLYYLIGVAASALFVVTYLQADLLASAALSAYLSIALFVGYFMWGKDSNPRPVTRVRWKWWAAYAGVTVLAYGGAVILVTLLGGSFAPWDSAILIFTLLAQFLLDRKKIENWAVWIVGVNLAGTVLYFTSGLYFIAIQQLLFGAASVWGWYEWNKSKKITDAPEIKGAKFAILYGAGPNVLDRYNPGIVRKARKQIAEMVLPQAVNGGKFDHGLATRQIQALEGLTIVDEMPVGKTITTGESLKHVGRDLKFEPYNRIYLVTGEVPKVDDDSSFWIKPDEKEPEG